METIKIIGLILIGIATTILTYSGNIQGMLAMFMTIIGMAMYITFEKN